ncbi:hypothetical protein D5086_014512 [Populus alba]|uniref:Uncharacterized protein n=1 Tax=Populus alba TaxID=43335 RepID=A0ACC4BYF2_POPAL
METNDDITEKTEHPILEDPSPRCVLEIPISGTDSDHSRSSSSSSCSSGSTEKLVPERTGIVRESNGIQWKQILDSFKKKSVRRFSVIPLISTYETIARKNLRRKLARIQHSADVFIDCEGIMAPKPSWRNFDYLELEAATDNFSSENLIGEGGHAKVYKGCLSDGQVVAVKKLMKTEKQEEDRVGDFLSELGIIAHINHPNAARLLGFSIDSGLHLVLEFLPHGSLANHGKRNRAFRWNHRIRVAHEICSGLSFLHLARPRPFAQVHLTASNVLLDRNLVAKIGGFRLAQSPDANETLPNIQAFGVLLFQLLTGRSRTGLVEEAMAMEKTALLTVLDERAGKWPLDLAYELAGIATRCLECKVDFSLAKTREELEKITRKADDLAAKSGCEVVVNGSIDDREDSSEAPSIFLCPILQEVMKNPHVAADGFSYELEAIEEWLNTGRDTSPMTNLRLKHKFLTPNHTLRSLIQEWNRRKSTAS